VEGGGWSVYDYRTRAQADVVCAPDCEFSGWQHQTRGRPVADSHCIRGECFKYGWNTYHAISGEWIDQVLCSKNRKTQEQNCFTEGWTVRDIRNRVSFRTECVAGDCLNLGWDTRYPNGQIQIARCKAGGCFESGWTLRP
jgi:hypothetical protein